MDRGSSEQIDRLLAESAALRSELKSVTLKLQAVDSASSYAAAIVNSSDDAIIGKSLDGVITSWNRAAERLFGYTAKEAIGQPISMLAPDHKVDETPRSLDRIRRGERVDPYE